MISNDDVTFGETVAMLEKLIPTEMTITRRPLKKEALKTASFSLKAEGRFLEHQATKLARTNMQAR